MSTLLERGPREDSLPVRSGYRPPVDFTRIAVVTELVAGAVAISWRLATRPPAPKAIVRMGPGGWVSVKGGAVRLHGRRYRPSHPARGRTADRRPVWARLLRARRVT